MSDYQLPDALERARQHALETNMNGVIDALREAQDEKQALTSAALAMRHEAARNAHRIQELERRLRSAGEEVPSPTSTPRGSVLSASPQVSPQPIGPRAAECGTQTASHPEFVLHRPESSAASTDEQPAAQASARGFSSTFVRGTPTSVRQSRGGTPNTQRERTFGAPSSQNSLRGQSAPPDPWATLGESASQVAAASGRASPNVTTSSFRGGRPANTFARAEGAAQPRPHRPAGIRRPVDASATTHHREAPTRHHGSPLRRPSSGPAGSRGAEAVRVILDEYGASLALGSTCVVAALVLYKLLLR
jgi:hypothetical protein